MDKRKITRIFLFIVMTAGCTVEFIPDISETKELLVVDGLITDQNSVYKVRLSRSVPIGDLIGQKIVSGAEVTITDENGVVTALSESTEGTYITDSTNFRGRVGGRYSLNVTINDKKYVTDFIEMKPVPPLDSIYYEKVTITPSKDSSHIEEGCRIYIDSYDPDGFCRFYRWNYTETWEYRIPYPVVYQICWITENSDEILIKNTSAYNQSKVTKYQVNFVTNKTDRLKVKYSILVRQYSLSEEEYEFWNKIQAVSQNVGNLYDKIPASITGNVKCITNPEENVVGYFSVSAMSQKRLFVDDEFLGLPNFPLYCATDTIYGILPEEGLNSEYWVIEDYANEIPPTWVITTYRECADCRTEGTKVRPLFWE